MTQTSNLTFLPVSQPAQGLALPAANAAAGDGAEAPAMTFADLLGSLRRTGGKAAPADDLAALADSDRQELPVLPEGVPLPDGLPLATFANPPPVGDIPPSGTERPRAGSRSPLIPATIEFDTDVTLPQATEILGESAGDLPVTQLQTSMARIFGEPKSSRFALPQTVMPASASVASAQPGAQAPRKPLSATTGVPALPVGQDNASVSGASPRQVPASGLPTATEALQKPDSVPLRDMAFEPGRMPERLVEPGNAPSSAQPLSALTPSVTLPAEPTQVRIATPFAQPGWSGEVEQKLTWVASNSRQEADLVLNPPQLGRIEVTLVVEGDKLNASFASPHQAVREALEESLNRLRETLSEAGINLGQTHVGRESSRDAPFMTADSLPRPGQRSVRAESEVPAIAHGTHAHWHSPRGRGMVDIFA